MELTSQVTLISAFGRGHWLAAALAREGLKVTLIDVTSKLGVWPSEDAEGPFGFFRNERMTDLQTERIFSDDPFEEVSSGFTLWLKSGPIEFKSPLTKFYFEKNEWLQAYYDLLSPSNTAGLSKNSTLYKTLAVQKFDQQWVIHLAHQWASTTYTPSAQAAKTGEAISLLSTFYVRKATRLGLEKSFHWLREKNVEVLTQTEIKDLSFEGRRQISGLELQGEKQGLFKTDQVVWMLTSEESFFVNEKVAKYLYPEGALEPEWCWVRYRVRLEDCPERNCLPLHLVLMADLHSPWTHENMMVLQRTALSEQFDAWIRLPNVQRFNKEYLTRKGQALCVLLKDKIETSDPTIQTYPQEYYYTYSQLGAARFPVFNEKDAAVQKTSVYKNLAFDGPEIWSQFTWDSALANQVQIRNNLDNWWKQKLIKFQKQQKQQGKDLNP